MNKQQLRILVGALFYITADPDGGHSESYTFDDALDDAASLIRAEQVERAEKERDKEIRSEIG